MNRSLISALLAALSWFDLFAQKTDTTIKGVVISFDHDPSIFPESWRVAPVNAFAEKLSPGEIKRSKAVIARALDHYPQSTLENIKKVYFLQQLKFYDVPYGGTNSTDLIYLVNHGTSRGYSDKYLEQTFHHEFSSILFRNFPEKLDTTEWKMANHPDFNYNDPENGVGAIRNKQSSQLLDSTLCEKGLLTQYGSSSIENDVNTFAQNLFLPEQDFWKMVAQYPAIRKKTTLLIGFYNRINPIFTEEYFKKLQRKKDAGSTQTIR